MSMGEKKRNKALLSDEHYSNHASIGFQVGTLEHPESENGDRRLVTPFHVPEIISGHRRSPAVFSAIT